MAFIKRQQCYLPLHRNNKCVVKQSLVWIEPGGERGSFQMLRLWALGGVINKAVNIGVSSMAALRRPLLQGRGRAEGYSVRSWQLSQNQSCILK